MTIRLGPGAYDPLVVPGDDTRYGAQYYAAWRFLETVARLRPHVLEDLAEIRLTVDEWDPVGGVVGVSTPYGWRSYERFVAFTTDVRTWAQRHGLRFNLAVVAGAHTRVAWAAGRRPSGWEFPGTSFWEPPTGLSGARPDPLRETHAQWRMRTDAQWQERVRELRMYPKTRVRTAPEHDEWLARHVVPPVESLSDMANGARGRGRFAGTQGPSRQAVSAGVHALAALIDLCLPAPQRGQPRQ
jgi:hypothetical protein